MGLVFLADRDQLHREGIQQFLMALHDALRYSDTPLYHALRRHFYIAAHQVVKDAPLHDVVASLRQALSEMLSDLDNAQKRHQDLAFRLDFAQHDARWHKEALAVLQAETSVANLRGWQVQIAALERDLQKVQSENVALERDLVQHRRLVAAREATITELNGIIAKQHIEFDTLFGAMEDSD